MKVTDPVRVFTNGGSQDYSERGTLNIINFDAYFNPTSMANILSLSEISETYRITMDTSASPSITVHLHDGTSLVFSKCGSGLYYYDIESAEPVTPSNGKSNEQVTNYSF